MYNALYTVDPENEECPIQMGYRSAWFGDFPTLTHLANLLMKL